jgi:exonuclease SbcD
MAKKKETAVSASRKPITILSTDWHLKESNTEQIKDLVRQKCELAKSLDINTVFCLGDIFDSRSSQKLSLLVAFSEILEIFADNHIELWAIPGNHDKRILESDYSFIDPFKYHPNFKYVPKAGMVPFGDVKVHMLPYFKENVWVNNYADMVEYIGDFDKSQKRVLLSHIATNQSVNNDGSHTDWGIAVGDFKQWDLVMLGHFHDQQQLGQNIYHIPSIQQNNFGENDQKGFTVLYDDLSFDLVVSSFTRYEKVKIDFDTTTKKELDQLVKKYADSDKNIRFEICGSADKVKSLDKEAISAMGIDVKIKVNEIEDTIQYAKEEVKNYTKDNIVEEFQLFCEEKEIDFEKGMQHLNKKIN